MQSFVLSNPAKWSEPVTWQLYIKDENSMRNPYFVESHTASYFTTGVPLFIYLQRYDYLKEIAGTLTNELKEKHNMTDSKDLTRLEEGQINELTCLSEYQKSKLGKLAVAHRLDAYLGYSRYLDDYPVRRDMKLRDFLQLVPELKDIAEKLQEDLGVELVYNLENFEEGDLKGLELTPEQENKIVEIAAEVSLKEKARK